MASILRGSTIYVRLSELPSHAWHYYTLYTYSYVVLYYLLLKSWALPPTLVVEEDDKVRGSDLSKGEYQNI